MKNNSLICKHIKSSLFFDNQNKVRFCPYCSDFAADTNLDGIWLNIDKIEQKRLELLKVQPKSCKDCKFYETYSPKKEIPQIKTLYIANWHFCYVDCVYCKSEKIEDLIKAKHYDFFPYFKELEDKKLVNKDTKVVFVCENSGDCCVHPEFDKIMFYFLNSGYKNIEVNTSAQRFCDSVAQGIARDIAKVIIPFDSACQYVYNMVKQINKFQFALDNLKKYLTYQMPNKKNVIVKYTITSGVNDNKKEPVDLFILARDLGVKKLIFDVEQELYEKSLDFLPLYLEEIIILLRDIAKYNAFDIEFTPRLNVLYKQIKERKNVQIR